MARNSNGLIRAAPPPYRDVEKAIACEASEWEKDDSWIDLEGVKYIRVGWMDDGWGNYPESTWTREGDRVTLNLPQARFWKTREMFYWDWGARIVMASLACLTTAWSCWFVFDLLSRV